MHLAPELIALLVAIAVVAGFIDAIAGGGGLITVPALLAVGVPPVQAIATNKVQSSVGTASATWSFWRAGKIDFHHIKIPLAATLAGAALGSLLLIVADTRWLMGPITTPSRRWRIRSPRCARARARFKAR